MAERPDHAPPAPLPREWLPEAMAPEFAPEWDVRAERIVAAAEPALRRLGERGSESDPIWSNLLGSWWRPAAALAGVAAVLLFVLDRPLLERRRDPGRVPLSVVAADGTPVALWQALGIEADPVLALIALQDRTR